MRDVWHKNFHNFFTWYNIKLNETENWMNTVLASEVKKKKHYQTHMPCNKAQRTSLFGALFTSLVWTHGVVTAPVPLTPVKRGPRTKGLACSWHLGLFKAGACWLTCYSDGCFNLTWTLLWNTNLSRVPNKNSLFSFHSACRPRSVASLLFCCLLILRNKGQSGYCSALNIWVQLMISSSSINA